MKKYLTVKNIAVFAVTLILLALGIVFQSKPKMNVQAKAESQISSSKILVSIEEDDTSSNELKSFFIDIKGAVKKPGVYQFNENQMIIDAISTAGGLTKNASTKNINLSKQLKPEMIIYIFTKSELSANNQTSSTCPDLTCPVADCKCETVVIKDNPIVLPGADKPSSSSKTDNTSSSNKPDEESSKFQTELVNINTASLDLLQTLPGIGEAKAKAIIEYRLNTKFNTVEDIKNVSGIGDAVYIKIKDLITI